MPSSRNGGVIILIILVVIVLYSYRDNIPSLTQLEQTGTTSQRDLSLRIDNRVTDFFEDKIFSIVQPESRELSVIIELNSRQEVDNVVRDLGGDAISFKYSEAVAGKINREELNRLIANPSVKSVYLDEVVHTLLQESVPLINADDVWNISVVGQQITGSGSVCVIDTGIDYTHPDLDQNYLGGIDFINNDSDPIDDHGHGTHVAGIVAANGVIKGVAPNVSLIAVKVLGSSGSGKHSDVVAGIEWCVTNKDLYDIKVITMSLGGSTLYSNYCDSYDSSGSIAVNTAVNNNIAVIAASGNSGSTIGISNPSCLSNIIAVGGSTKEDSMYINGNRNNLISVLAPGVSIMSTCLGGTYCSKTGTSMAAPHIAGVSNLLQQFAEQTGKTLSPSQIKEILKNNGQQVFDIDSLRYFTRVESYYSLLAVDNGNLFTSTTTTIPAAKVIKQGPNDGSIFLNDESIGIHPWSNPNFGKANDNIYSTVRISQNNTANWLVVKGFNFNIPSNSTIIGITVDVKGYHQSISGNITGFSVPYKLIKNGNVVLQSYPSKSSSYRDDIYSTQGKGYSDLWQTDWTPADINSPDFGFALVRNIFGTLIEDNYIDHIRVSVYYSPGVEPIKSSELPGSIFLNDESIGIHPWSNPNFGGVYDDIYSTVYITDGIASNWLVVKGFNFNIPSDAVINDIVVKIRGETIPGTGIPIIIGIVKNNIIREFIQPNGCYLWGAVGSAYKDCSNLAFGDTWTPADINSPDFGFASRVPSDSFQRDYLLRIDNAVIYVYYTPAISTEVITSTILTTSILTTTSSIPTTISTSTSTSSIISTTPTTSVITTSTSSIPTTTSILASTSTIVTTIPTTIASTTTSTTTSIIQIATGNATSQIGGLALSREGQLTTTSQSTTSVQTTGGGTSTSTITLGIQQPIEPEKINPLVIIGIIALIWWLSKKR